MNKVGIAIINFNSGEFLKATLASVMAAKTRIPFAVAVIDNGSEESQCRYAREYLDELAASYPDAELEFVDAGKNLGFSGGNNVLIKKFMEDSNITHICLLNSDVIVTDYWLDYMLEKDCDVIGPVTNAAGNEQTIQIDYTMDIQKLDVNAVQTFAQKRHTSYQGYTVETDLVTFFATIFKREVIEKIGLLDEQFYPGSYEDDDYCVRTINAGYHIMIARDVFLHHFGSGSFAKLNMDNRKNIGNINRERFEKKWNCKWKDRTWKLLESCKQDMDFLLNGQKTVWEKRQLDTSLKELENLMADWGEAINFFTAQADRMAASETNYSAKQLVKLLWEKVKRKFAQIIGRLKSRWNAFIHKKENERKKKDGMDRIYNLIEGAGRKGHKAICVFAPMYNKENEKDGYVQRIKAIDTTVLADMCRIYLYDEGTVCENMRFDYIDELHGYIVFNSHNKEQLQEILKLVKACGATYTHSLLRFMEDRTSRELWQIFDEEGVTNYWDVHGTVPEEYAMSGSELGSELANTIEKVMAEKVDVIVVVTQAMGRYLQKKYPAMKAKIVVVPILNKELLKPERCTKDFGKQKLDIVYAGGTQPWQNIELMQNVIEATADTYQYRMFVPDTEEFWRLWGSRKAVSLRVESKSPEDLYKEYETCDLGFVLRDSSPVNYVACPTKIIEYLKFGIIPVLKSDEIGDFVALGMQYVAYKQLLEGEQIPEQKRMQMMEANYKVLEKLKDMYVDGIQTLKNQVEGK